ncbi:MAG: AAA domain-containing protein [Candidatus Xenobiia bacterium LiM19]
MNIKYTKPSEAYSLKTGTLVRIRGRINGRISYSSEYGGRFIIPICDIDSQKLNDDAKIVINITPQENPHLPMGIKEPIKGLLTLLQDELFSPLFKRGASFEAEAILGFVRGEPWFNVFYWFIFEPHIAIGVRQIIGEPICQRRILLANRGVHLTRKSRDYNKLGGLILGDLVHVMFQEMVMSGAPADPDFKNIIASGYFESMLPLRLAFRTAILALNDASFDIKKLIGSANHHFQNLVNSCAIMSLVGSMKWYSEAPLAVPFVHGKSDLRNHNVIIELKTGIHRSDEHERQLGYYLVADMMGFGTEKTIENNRGFIIRSSSTIQQDQNRKTEIIPDLELLSRFLVYRHRYILVMANNSLPRIEFTVSDCQECPYFQESVDRSVACHFYCQVERNWKCDDCLHSSVCKESHNYHSYEAIDEANRIRFALLEEIRLERLRSGVIRDLSERRINFILESKLGNGLLVLSPETDIISDPPREGSFATLHFADSVWGTNCEVVDIDFEDKNKWLISVQCPSSNMKCNSKCSLSLPQYRIRELFDLLFCVDKLQRVNMHSSNTGLAFAGGQVLSGKIDKALSLDAALKSDSTDIFCQSFSLKDSFSYLDIIINEKYDSTLIISELKGLEKKIPNSFCLSTIGIREIIKNQKRFEMMINQIKKTLETTKVWIVSPDFLSSDLISYLPNSGNDYFDLVIFMETHSVNALEYFLLRNLGKKRIVIGDANTLGKSMDSPSAIQLGLDNNVMQRVTYRGFPSTENSKPLMIQSENQLIASEILRAMESCRLVLPEKPKSEVEFSIIEHEFVATKARQIQEIEEFYIYKKDDKTRTMALQAESYYSEYEIQNDLESLELLTSLMPGNLLISPLTGNRYTVIKSPQIVSPNELDDDKFKTKWIIEVIRGINNIKLSWNENEAKLIADKVRDLLGKGVKQKNIAILSPFIEQLNHISSYLCKDGDGIALRTPYSISGLSWSNVIISCVLDTLIDCPQDIINPRMIYTMIRSGSTRIVIMGHKKFLANHPFLRNC